MKIDDLRRVAEKYFEEEVNKINSECKNKKYFSYIKIIKNSGYCLVSLQTYDEINTYHSFYYFYTQYQLKEYYIKIINFHKEKIKSLIKGYQEENEKICK